MSKELRIPGYPTTGPQPWPAELDGLMPDFANMTTINHGWEYGVKDPNRGRTLPAPNSDQFRVQNLDLIAGKVTLTVEDNYTPYAMSGNHLVFTLDLNARTYDVTLGDHDYFDEEEYNETDESERLVGIIPFKEPLNGSPEASA